MFYSKKNTNHISDLGCLLELLLGNGWEEESPELRIQKSRGSNSHKKQAVHVAGSVVSTAK